ncbi:MAG: Rib/alpha-like domain-containing protein, partial [Finegoldia magna]|nr:Rib/alpha-like domain-containing protein [Finegoldia magna]
SVGADPSTSSGETRQIDVEVNVDLLGLNNDAQQFNKDLLPDIIIAEITYTGADGKPYTTTVEIDKNNLNATVKAPLPVDAKNGELSVKFTNLKDMTSSEGYGSTKIVDGKITGFTITGHLGQYANPKVNLEVKNPYGRDEERKDDGDLTGKLNITGGDDPEDLNINNKSLEFSFPKGTTEVDTHVNEDTDEQDNNIFDLSYPGNNPKIAIDGEDTAKKEVTIGEIKYKVTEKTYNTLTGGKIVLTTTDPIIEPQEGDQTPEGYVRVVIKPGEGVESFEQRKYDVIPGTVLPAEKYPVQTLTPKEGYRDEKWSLAPGSIINGETTITASATKKDNLAFEPTSKVVIKKIKIAPTEEEIKKAVSVPGYPQGKSFTVTLDDSKELKALDKEDEYDVHVTVKYADKTTDKGIVKVKVIGGHNFDYEPTTKVIETTVNKLPDAKDGIANKADDTVEDGVKKLPADSKFKWFEEPDVSEGTKEGKEVKGKVQVTYPDDSHDVVEVTVKVKDTREDKEKYTATGGTIEKKLGEKTETSEVIAKVTTDYLKEATKKPVVTVKKGEKLPDGSKAGTFKVKTTVTYPDTTADEVEVTVIVGGKLEDIKEIADTTITNKDQTVVEHNPIQNVVITPGDPEAKVTVGELPAGLTYDESSKTISGTPTIENWGTDEEREVTVEVSTGNKDGSGTTDKVKIKVQRDTDGDGIPDVTDDDDDGDGIPDKE